MKTLLSFLLVVSPALAAPPSAKEILESVRLRQAQQELNLQGQLREGATIVPFPLTQTGPLIRYSFTKPDEALQLRLGDNDSRLREGAGRSVVKNRAAALDAKARR